MKYTKKDLKNNTLQFLTEIPWSDIESKYEGAFKKLIETTEIEGFRKGKAPADIAKKHIPKEKVYDQLINDILPEMYREIIEKEKIRPFMSPKVELKSAKENEPWSIEFTVALEPTLTLADYKKVVADIKASKKKDDIWVPGKEPSNGVKGASDDDKLKKQEEYINEILKNLVEKSTLHMSDVIVEQEVTNRLSKLVDDVRAVGLTLDSYLKSKNLTIEQVKEGFAREIKDAYSLELILGQIAESEKIEVKQQEVEALYSSIKDPAQRKEAEKNTYFYTIMLRKQKAIDLLSNL